jgi:hypothetical protein
LHEYPPRPWRRGPPLVLTLRPSRSPPGAGRCFVSAGGVSRSLAKDSPQSGATPRGFSTNFSPGSPRILMNFLETPAGQRVRAGWAR